MTTEVTAKGEAALLRQACDKFTTTFGRNPTVAGAAPGRVNFIGEHIDYCEGYVLPVALPFLTVVVGAANNSSTCNVVSILTSGEELKTSFGVPTPQSPLKPGEPAWANYVKGVVANFPVLALSFAHNRFYRRDYTYFPEFDAFYKLHWDEGKVSWNTAFEACYEERAQLFYPKEKGEWTIVKDLIAMLPQELEATDAIVGIHDEFNQGDYTTVDGTVTPAPVIKSWPIPEGHNCIIMDTLNEEEYKTDSCDANPSTKRLFICKKVEEKPCPTIDTEYKYLVGAKKCYKIHDAAQSWPQAWHTCYIEGGVLMLPENDLESEVINDLIYKDTLYFSVFRRIFPDSDFYTVKGRVKGFDAVIVSDVPMGAGLSSSASIEVATFTFLEALTGVVVDPVTKAKLCQKAEHEFPGMPCGIMDQYISTMGKKDHALLIDCRSLESTQIQVELGDAVILVTNSNVKHQLTGSEYPQRRAQCQEAADILGLPSLRGAKLTDLEELKRQKCDKLVRMRAEHVIKEIQRTEEVARIMPQRDLKRVGELLYQSHDSLSNLMEVSCPELDQLVDIMRNAPGVYGARMTGGGFGGCVISLVQKSRVDELKKRILSQYKGTPTFFVCLPSDGARILNL